MKQLLFNKEAREKLAKGADTLAQAVVSTLGPRSRNVTIQRKGLTPLVAHDGVTVAQAVTPLKDPFENLGAELLKEAAANTNALAGDGTTTATLIANYLIQNGMKLLGGGLVDGEFKKNINPMEMRDRFAQYSETVCKMLDESARKLEKDDVLNIAKISAASDEIAALVMDAVNKVGESGLIMTGPSERFESYVEYKEGMEFDNGYLSPYFMTDPNKAVAEYSDAYILLANKVISDHQEITPILEKVNKEHGSAMPVIIIADDVIGFALQGLIQLKLKGTLPTCAIVAPEYADRRKEMLEDLAIITGGVVFSPDKKDDLKNMELKHLGRAAVRVSATSTLLTPKFPDKEEIAERAEAVKEQIKVEENLFRKERLEWRLAKLTQGIAVIRVGGGSEAEVNDKKLRIDDAVHAVRAALLEGAVVGGGMALHNIGLSLGSNKNGDIVDDLVMQALCQPFEALMTNSGIDPSFALGKLTKGKADVYDVVSKKAVEAFKAGIIDPVKVTKLAVKHAFSVAGMFLTTDTLIVDEPTTDVQKIKVVNHENA